MGGGARRALRARGAHPPLRPGAPRGRALLDASLSLAASQPFPAALLLPRALLRADAAGFLLAAVPADGGGAALLSLDVARGAVRWSVSAGGGAPAALFAGVASPQRALLATTACAQCVGAAGGDVAWVRCYPRLWAAAAGAWGALLLTQDAPVGTAALSLSVLDEATGAQLWVVAVPPEALSAAAAAASSLQLFALSPRAALVLVNGSNAIIVDGFAGASGATAGGGAAPAAPADTGAVAGAAVGSLLAGAALAVAAIYRQRWLRFIRVAPEPKMGPPAAGADAPPRPPTPPPPLPAPSDEDLVRGVLLEVVEAALLAAAAAGTPPRGSRRPSIEGHETPQSEGGGGGGGARSPGAASSTSPGSPAPLDDAMAALLARSAKLASRTPSRRAVGSRGAARAGSAGGAGAGAPPATPRAAPLPARSRALGAAGGAALESLLGGGGRSATAALIRHAPEEARGPPSRARTPVSRLGRESPYWVAGGNGNLPFVGASANPHAPFFAPAPPTRALRSGGLNFDVMGGATLAQSTAHARGKGSSSTTTPR